VSKREVLVVTIQYRLGYLGFFSTGDDACDDNVGLWDMTAALHWIQRNIVAFGGDPENVTLFGQSAGGDAVDLLSLSPHSRDLFHKVIPMAGCTECDWSICEESVETCREIASQLGVPTHKLDSQEIIKRLKSLPSEKFALALSFDGNPASKMKTAIGPRIDGKFLPKPLAELRAEAPKKKRLIGLCQHEGLIFYDIASGKKMTVDSMQQIIAGRIPEGVENCKQLREDALRLYIDPVVGAKSEVQTGFVKLISDFFLSIGTQKNVLEQLRVGNDSVYLYSFDYFNPNAFKLGFLLPLKGATHCMEIPYLFEVSINGSFRFNEDDYKMLELTTKLWSNFAKYGDPNGPPAEGPDSDARVLPFEWLPVSSEFPSRCLSIKLEPEMREELLEGRPRFWVEKIDPKIAGLTK